MELEIDRAAGADAARIGKMTLRTTAMECVYDVGTKLIGKNAICVGSTVIITIFCWDTLKVVYRKKTLPQEM